MVRWLVGLGLAIVVSGAFDAVAETRGSAAYKAAEDAVRAFRDESFLPTACESAFRGFWKRYTADGPEGVVYERPLFGAPVYFGLGNPAAEDDLNHAIGVCTQQSGGRGDMIVRVMRDRERYKTWRTMRAQHAERLIHGEW